VQRADPLVHPGRSGAVQDEQQPRQGRAVRPSFPLRCPGLRRLPRDGRERSGTAVQARVGGQPRAQASGLCGGASTSAWSTGPRPFGLVR
jgi:hypothetical protein